MKKAIVTKGIGGLYELLNKEGEHVTVQSRGRHKASGIFVGDWVKYSQENVIEEVLPRKNSLVRPPLANVEQQVLIFTLVSPPLHRELLEKMLLQGELENIENIIVLQKMDLIDEKLGQELAAEYELAGYKTFLISALEGLGLDGLKSQLKGKISVFAGPSGVGKSSILNALYSEYELETGELSEKIQRGRHTTRHTQLYGDWDRGLVADTPGFYLLDTPKVEPIDLAQHFPELRPALNRCKFTSCLHEGEPGCAVQELVDAKKISPARFEFYLSFLADMKEYKRGQYS
ncbi:MAG: ribosome small subunit-dependent GTPase A [Firmicutes bacterium]|jgi:ribosome biogenesis GTPase|nr:ribosome small subunit-dependent GTPase A [Bacillota bacterium]